MFNKKSKILKYRERKFKRAKRTGKILKKSRAISYRTKKRIIVYGTLLIAIFAIYFMFFSKIFILKGIIISENNTENQALAEEIKEQILETIGKNLLLINNEDLETKIIANFPALEKLEIYKKYPNQIEIEFLEYPLVANIINESAKIKKSYVINSIGFAIKENLENKSLPYIRIKSEEPVNTSAAVIDSNKLNYILETIQNFEEKFGMQIQEVEYKKTAREIHLLTEKGFYIWLDIQKPYEAQLKKLKKSIIKLDIYKTPLHYIDLRIAGTGGDKIIYKRK